MRIRNAKLIIHLLDICIISNFEIYRNPWEHIEYILKIQQREVNKLELS